MVAPINRDYAPREWPAGDDAIRCMRAVHSAIACRRLSPWHPLLLPLGAQVVSALRERDLDGVRAACGAMVLVVAGLPRGDYQWGRVRARPSPAIGGAA
jgi:hypothetical protein